MPFAEWLVISELRLWGWPRKRGLRRVSVVDGAALSTALLNAIQVMLGLGARDVDLALRLATELSVHQNKAEVDYALTTLQTQAERKIAKFGSQRPWRSLMAVGRPGGDVEVPLTEGRPGEEELEWDHLGKEPFASMIAMWPAEGLAWGLSHPREVDQAFDAAITIGQSILPNRSLLSLADFDELCKELVVGYEREVAPLPRYPVP